MPTLLDRLGVSLPVLQAGMGGGIAGHALAAAVSEAGALGTLGIFPPGRLRAELHAARVMTGKPIAVNLLLPFAGGAHWEVAREADAVVTFWGAPARRTSGVWIHQCGSLEEARAAQTAGADAVIAQGVEAGGHVRGTLPALELLEQIQGALPGYEVLVAGGIADAADVRRALEAGASGAVAGTRFLLSDESDAHPGYKRRALAGDRTLLTELFGFGWPAPHRVIPNAATDRWLSGDPRGPALVRALNRAGAVPGVRLPLALADRMARSQRPGVPLFSPAPPLRGSPERMLDAAPLYAGETVTRIEKILPAAQLVNDLAS